MTRSDILFKRRKAGDLVEKSNLSKEEKDEIQAILTENADILDSFWLMMLHIANDQIKYKDKNDKLDILISKVYKSVKDMMLMCFKEMDYPL